MSTFHALRNAPPVHEIAAKDMDPTFGYGADISDAAAVWGERAGIDIALLPYAPEVSSDDWEISNGLHMRQVEANGQGVHPTKEMRIIGALGAARFMDKLLREPEAVGRRLAIQPHAGIDLNGSVVLDSKLDDVQTDLSWASSSAEGAMGQGVQEVECVVTSLLADVLQLPDGEDGWPTHPILHFWSTPNRRARLNRP